MSRPTVDLGGVLSDQPGQELLTVYGHALRDGGAPADEQAIAATLKLPDAVVRDAIETLTQLRLLRVGAGPDGPRLMPVDPEIASASLISPIDEEIHRHTAAVSRIRQHLSAFRPQYERMQRPGPPDRGIEEVHDAEELAGHLYLAAQHCRTELVALRPNQNLPADRSVGRELFLPAGPGILDRGVRVRLLLQHAARTDIRARAQLDGLVARGAQVRTTGELSRQLILFDAEVAFVLHQGNQTGPAGVIIRSPSAVQLLLNLVETTWSGAAAYVAHERGYEQVTDQLRGTIISLLADGLTDEAVARRLGVSVRTCRRHIASVLRDLDAVSRFQAGVRVGAAAHQAPSLT
ncbi:helix-turn-helix domain-containing protein [Cryptosporangium sp. NPDC051539]|uniref:helix-turn-helix transcriptional regulator n=1 Tax=Cryptosporangium sp. NPDC051539 TaxID=3363962 RepID=UPI0037A6A4DD